MVKYLFLMVDSNMDFVIVQQGACKLCTENKISSGIFKAWNIPKSEVLHGKKHKYFTQLYNIACECDEYQQIIFEKI